MTNFSATGATGAIGAIGLTAAAGALLGCGRAPRTPGPPPPAPASVPAPAGADSAPGSGLPPPPPAPVGPPQVVDLGDEWAPFILQDSSGQPGDAARPNAYRATFVALANERANVDGMAPRRGEHNYLEVFGIPPTLSVLRARIEDDLLPERQACYASVDAGGDRKSTRLNSSHPSKSRMPSSA